MDLQVVPVQRADVEAVVADAFEAHHVDLLGFARSCSATADEAEDLAQEAFMRLTVEARAGRFPTDVRPWLFRVCLNAARSRWRRSAVAERLRPLLAVGRPPLQPDEEVQQRSDLAVLRRVVAGLPGTQRAAFLLTLSGVPGPEIASIIGRSPAATRMTIWRAREAVRAAMSREARP